MVFRKNWSCKTLIETVNSLKKSLNDRKQVDSILLDFSKAFDKVCHRKLILKLKNYGISTKLLSWIDDFFQWQNTECCYQRSATRKINCQIIGAAEDCVRTIIIPSIHQWHSRKSQIFHTCTLCRWLLYPQRNWNCKWCYRPSRRPWWSSQMGERMVSWVPPKYCCLFLQRNSRKCSAETKWDMLAQSGTLWTINFWQTFLKKSNGKLFFWISNNW